MGRIKKVNIRKLILVLSLAFFVAILNVSKVIFGAFKTTKDVAYLGIGHYLSDYLLYIQQIVQGMRGHWLVENPFTTNDSSKTFIAYGQYLLLGKLARILHWSPYFAYWFSVFILSIILVLLMFYLIRRLLPNENFLIQISTLLLSLFATPFIRIVSIENRLQIIPHYYWYAPMNIFDRFGTLPHHLMTTILIILVLLLLDSVISGLYTQNWAQILKKNLVIIVLLIFILTFAPFQVINLMSALLVVSWIYLNLYLLKNSKKSILKLIVFLGLTIIAVVPSAIFFKISVQSIDYFKRGSLWEITQLNYPLLWQIIAVNGPILIFVPFGIMGFFKSKTPIKFLFFFYVFFCYIYYYSPLAGLFGSHNGRFINSIVYVLFGVLTILGMRATTSILTRKPILLIILIIAFLSYFFIVTGVIYRTLPEVDVFSYLPKGLFTGIKTLDQSSDDKIVLTSPMLPLGLIVPIVADRKVYLGRSITTPDYENKTVIVHQFYEGIMTDDQARQFIKENNIGYVILSPLETHHFGSYKSSTLENYSFLKIFYENNAVKIFKVL